MNVLLMDRIISGEFREPGFDPNQVQIYDYYKRVVIRDFNITPTTDNPLRIVWIKQYVTEYGGNEYGLALKEAEKACFLIKTHYMIMVYNKEVKNV